MVGSERKKLPLGEEATPFFATGLSLITHMANPKVPTAHMNLRYIETPNRFWFGGVYDLTPMGFAFAEDCTHFHRIAKTALETFSEFFPYLLLTFSISLW